MLRCTTSVNMWTLASRFVHYSAFLQEEETHKMWTAQPSTYNPLSVIHAFIHSFTEKTLALTTER